MEARDYGTQRASSSHVQTPLSPRLADKGAARTPITAFFVEPRIRDQIEEIVRPTRGSRDGALIPICRYGAALEPTTDLTQPTVIAAVDDRRGMQILLLEINGRTQGRDGIPYHAIWSCDEAAYGDTVVDKEYRWPVSHLEVERTDFENMRTIFCKVTRDMRYERTLTRAELAAESLARTAHPYKGSASFTNGDFDFFQVNIPVGVKPLARVLEKNPDAPFIDPGFFRIDFAAGGKRKMTPVTWDTPAADQSSWLTL